MLKYVLGALAIAFVCGTFWVSTGCKEAHAMNFFSKKELTVGKDITINDIKDFYYTIDASTNPPKFQRYRFSNKDGQYTFYHEKREGNSWPLKEKDITLSGTVELSNAQWQQFFSYIKNGKVTKRSENTTAGGRGPWLFLYWTKDKGTYQVFDFADYDRRNDFENLCVELKEAK